MGITADTFVRGIDFASATGEKTGANLEDLATRLTPTNGSELVDQDTLVTYLDGVLGVYRIKLAAALSGAVVPAGAITAFGGGTAPSGYLECNGAAVSRTTYSGLFAVIGENWGQGDNVTTFNLPDLRGKFPRGYDHGIGNDPDAATRTAQATGGKTGDNVGSIQACAVESHTHTDQEPDTTGKPTEAPSNPDVYMKRANATTGAYGGNETRPINASVMYCIKT